MKKNPKIESIRAKAKELLEEIKALTVAEFKEEGYAIGDLFHSCERLVEPPELNAISCEGIPLEVKKAIRKEVNSAKKKIAKLKLK